MCWQLLGVCVFVCGTGSVGIWWQNSALFCASGLRGCMYKQWRMYKKSPVLDMLRLRSRPWCLRFWCATTRREHIGHFTHHKK